MADPKNVKSIFLAAVEKPAAERSEFLEQATVGDAALRLRVEALLKAHDNPDGFLEDAAAEFGATVDLSPAEPPLAERPGTLIGPYKLLEQIGEGGMGVVYMADQQAPIRRRVALKIIKAGMDTRQVIARFEAERQALALMDHANIARVLDAGATESGRPYFVMELVCGIPITEYCDQNNLPVHERLELFVQVCHAVQHAHQKGIIHRDLKPSNVLVTLNDGRAVPKVIDFGVAKAAGQQLTEKTLFTAFAQMVGTPLYMSPEQAAMTSLDVDTRSDIYSLGVLLYELLTGTTPFDPQRMRSAAFDEILRIVREEEPPKPSTRISTLGESRTATAAHRQVDSQRLGRLVEGDLDWIVMKCLEKDRTRRYDTANTLALDVQRHLNDQPVEARRPTRIYRLNKYIRRNKVGVVAGSAVIAALVVGFVVASVGYLQARRQAEIARTKAAQREQVVLFLKDTLQATGLPHESELVASERLFDDASLLAAEDKVESAKLIRLRATLRARIGRWDEAAADCLKANELALDGGDWSFDSALLLLKAGLDDDYRRVCHVYLEHVGINPEFLAADMAAKISLLQPVDGADFTRACELADFAATATGPDWHVACVALGKALAEYRRGRFDSAHDWADRAIANENIFPRHQATAYFIKAAAYAREQQIELAHTALGKGDAVLKQPYGVFKEVVGDTWCDWIIAEHLRREAAELLQRPAPAAPP